MKAVVFKNIKEPLVYEEIERPTPTDDQIVVKLKTAALNRRDWWIMRGMYPGIVLNTILGSDGAGALEDGREVIINPNDDWGDNPLYPKKTYTMLGLERFGTMAEEVVVGKDKVVDKPPHLTWEQAAALPLAGMTAYRALFTKGAVQAGDKVLITGVGGGVALIAMQLALAAGAEVYVTSGSDEKIENAVAMGAAGGINYKTDGWGKTLGKMAGRFNLIIDSAGGAGFNNLVRVCDMGAKIVVYGGTVGNWENITPSVVFFKQITILGTTMATDAEFEQMVTFVNEHQIVPVVDAVYPLAEANTALDRMTNSDQFGKIVLKCE